MVLHQEGENMVTEIRRKCTKCGKEFKIKGYWWNQYLIHHYADYIYIWHWIFRHREHLKIGVVWYLIKNTLKWVPLILLQIIDLPFELLIMFLNLL